VGSVARKLFSSFYDIWSRHEAVYSNLFKEALILLSKKDRLNGDEDALCELLCPILNRLCFEKGKNGGCEVQVPSWERPIHPVSNGELTGGKIRKRPDFTCTLVNSFALTEEDYEIPLHIECKRLGMKTSSSWILNENYVKNGIFRFDSGVHRYGNRAPSGVMIGFITSMDQNKIESEVNKFISKLSEAKDTLSFSFYGENLFTSIQVWNRKTLAPRDFKLIHYWIDMRKSYVS
jgi:hypothetical protein